MKNKLLAIVLASTTITCSNVLYVKAENPVSKTVKCICEKSGCLCITPLVVIGGVAITTISSYIFYKLGQKNYFKTLSKKEIKIEGESNAEMHLTSSPRLDLIGTNYIKWLFENEIPKLDKSNTFKAKYLANVAAIITFTRCYSEISGTNSSMQAKQLGQHLQAIDSSITNLFINRTTTIKYLTELLKEADSLLKQATQIIDNELFKKSK